jgi:hypothetical protein
MPDDVIRPQGGVDERKYAALARACALLRGVLTDMVAGGADPAECERILANTSLANIASACGYSEAELAIRPSDFLDRSELEGIAWGAGKQ